MTRATKTKMCRVCKKDRALREFHRDDSMRDGRRNQCKSCRNKSRRHSNERQDPSKQPVPSTEAEALRNAFVILRDRHREEFEKILSTERWRLRAKRLPEEDRWKDAAEIVENWSNV